MSVTPSLTDTRDMKWVHDAFRRAFGDAPGQIESIADGDTRRAQSFAGYLGEVLWLLSAHHAGEDELLYPLLAERVPEAEDLFSRMEAQHAAVTVELEAAQEAAGRFGRSGSSEDGRALASACRSLLDTVAGHLTEEEEEVVPIASRTVTPEEWGALPAHAFSLYSGSRPWFPLGVATEMFPDDVRAQVFTYYGFDSDAFTNEIAAIRGTGA